MGSAKEKIERVVAALERQETDRVPVGEFFWSDFKRRASAELAGGGPFDPYRYWDLDLIVITPNSDPHVRGIEVLERTQERVLVRTGFGATIERRGTHPMPRFLAFETESFEEIEALRLDDPADPRRYFEAIDDQLNSVADDLVMGYPSFAERVALYREDFCLFGSVCEPYEMLWRIVGTENALIKLAEDPERMAEFVRRLGDFLVGMVRGQVAAAEGRLTGLYLWGDLAYDKGMLFSPALWRQVIKPELARIVAAAHECGLKVIYHSCGDVRAVLEDLIEVGTDALNPLEAKAGLEVRELKRRFGSRWSFNGNIDVRVLATNDPDSIRREVLGKLEAARGGGYILQSDHSIPGDVAPASYEHMVHLARQSRP